MIYSIFYIYLEYDGIKCNIFYTVIFQVLTSKTIQIVFGLVIITNFVGTHRK